MQCKQHRLTVFSMPFLLSRLTHINEAQNTYWLYRYELQEEEGEGFHTLSIIVLSFFSIMGDIWEITLVTYLGANWANKHVSHTIHLHHPSQASREYLAHALCNALWEERDCLVLCVSVSFVYRAILCVQCCVGGWWMLAHVSTLLNCPLTF